MSKKWSTRSYVYFFQGSSSGPLYFQLTRQKNNQIHKITIWFYILLNTWQMFVVPLSCRVPGQCVGDLPGSVSREESQHCHCTHVHLHRAAPLCGFRGEWQGGAAAAAGWGGASHSVSAHRSSLWQVQMQVIYTLTHSSFLTRAIKLSGYKWVYLSEPFLDDWRVQGMKCINPVLTSSARK